MQMGEFTQEVNCGKLQGMETEGNYRKWKLRETTGNVNVGIYIGSKLQETTGNGN